MKRNCTDRAVDLLIAAAIVTIAFSAAQLLGVQ